MNENAEPPDQQQTKTIVRVLHDYLASDATCLSIKAGDFIEVIAQDPSGWWDGCLGTRRGWFPSNYVEILPKNEMHLVKERTERMAKSRIKFDALSKTLETVMLEHMEPNSGSNSPTSIINASKQPGAISTFSDYSKTNGSNTTAFDLPKQWHKRTDPSNGKPYYFNSDTNYSTYSLEDVLKSDVGSSDGSDSTDRNQPPSDPQPALKTAGSSTSDWGTESLIDDHTQINWEILINNILFCISELNHSAKNDLHELFVTQTNQVICAIRDLLTFTTAVFPEADVLKANPPLLESQQKIMKNLAKLVLASRFGSGLWPPPDSCGRIRYFAGQVLLAVRNFVLYAQKIGIVLNKDIDNQNTSFDQYGTLLAEQELLVRLSNSEKSIVEKLAELKDTLQTTSFADSTKSHMFLIEMHNLIEQVGELMAIIEDVSGSYLEGEEFDPSRYLPSLNKTKDKLYVVLSGMVNIVSSCVNSSKWPSDTVTALNSVILNAKGSVTDVVNATKLVLHNKENLVFKEPLKDGDTVATPETASDIYELIYLRRQTLSISTAIGCNVGQRSALDNTESSKNSGDIDKAVTAPPIMGITTGLSYALNVTGPKIAEESRLYSPINASPLPQQSQPTSDSSSTASPGYHSRPPSRITSTESAFSERDGSKQVPQKHDFLSRDYARNELAFNSKGALVGGTFKALVAYLTIHDRPVDPNFMSVFLLTFHSFSTPFDVFNALVERFNIKQPEGLSETQRLEWEEKKRKPIQIRVGIILRIWLESYWMTPDDDQVIDKLHEFALEKIEPTYTQVFNRLIDVLNRKLDYNRKEIITSSLPRHSSVSGNQPTGGTSQKALPPTPIIPKTSKKMSVLDIDPTEMVRQVTLLEARVFCKIAPVELLDQEWTKSTSRAANVHQMAQMSNKITLWTVSNIVSEADLKKRASILKFFIKVSEAGLATSAVTRLKRTWSQISSKYKSIYHSIERLTDHTQNYSAYRVQLRSSMPPALPFVGIFLTALTFVNEGNAAMRRDGELINFDKHNKIARIIKDLTRFQIMFNYTPVADIQKFLLASFEAQGTKDVHALYEASLALEPNQ